MAHDKNSWQWQIQNAIKTPEQLLKYINLTEKEYKDIETVIKTYKMSITPYYASLMDKNNKNCPIRRMVLPDISEINNTQHIPDMKKECLYKKADGIRQEYKEKCNLIVTTMCPNYCRFCFRKYWVGRTNDTLSYKQINDAIDELKKNKSLEEVSLSGGDPLILSDKYLDFIITKLKEVKHITVVRINTRIPVFLPQRITDNLVEVFKKHPTLYVCVHFNHPKELTKEAISACRKLVDNGIPVLNQSVLLKGVNDRSEIMRDLLWKLVENKIKPFYLYHCIKTMGNDYLITKVDSGQNILKKLYCHISALAIPLYIVSLYGGKALVMPDYVEKDEKGEAFFRNLKGEKFYLENLE